MHAVERQVKRHKSTVLAAGNHFGPASLPYVCAISSSGGDWEDKKSVPLAKEDFSDCSEYGIFLCLDLLLPHYSTNPLCSLNTHGE